MTKEYTKAKRLLEYFGSPEKAVNHVDSMLRNTPIDRIDRIDYWLDVRNILKAIA